MKPGVMPKLKRKDPFMSNIAISYWNWIATNHYFQVIIFCDK